MALIKQKTTKGIDCEYWIISNIGADKFKNETTIMFALYLDRQARLDDTNNVLDYLSITVSRFGLTIGDCYEFALQAETPLDTIITNEDGSVTRTPFFADAIDG